MCKNFLESGVLENQLNQLEQEHSEAAIELRNAIIKYQRQTRLDELRENPFFYRRIRCDLARLKFQHIFDDDESMNESIDKVKDNLGQFIINEWGEDYLYMDFDETTLTEKFDED